MKTDRKPKFKKDKGEQAMPDALPPPPPTEDAAAPPPPSTEGDARRNPNKGKGKGKSRGAPPECPEGTVALDDGSCAPIQ
jgi:hypothetical protein